jgi:hypothetical protein
MVVCLCASCVEERSWLYLRAHTRGSPYGGLGWGRLTPLADTAQPWNLGTVEPREPWAHRCRANAAPLLERLVAPGGAALEKRRGRRRAQDATPTSRGPIGAEERSSAAGEGSGLSKDP